MAAPVFALENVRLAQGGRMLMDDLSLFIGARDRLALIGRNGAGKTTLMHLITGRIEPDAGRRTLVPGVRIVHLPQDPSFEGCATLADHALAGDAAARHEIEAIADQLGLDLGRPAGTASGGERRRAALARALGSAPDLLLLDEPTNHLDLAAIEWLEQWLGRYRGAFLVVSHDRTFLTRLTRACLWLDGGRLRRQDIGFGGFEAWAEQVREDEARAASRLDARLAQELHWLQRGVTARRRRNQGRLARLEELREQRRAMLGQSGPAKLALATDDSRSKMVIEAADVALAYGSRTILSGFSIRIQRGDRIGIVGPNGAGKTSLLRLLTGDLAPDSGRVVRAAGLTGVTIDQQRRLMDPDKRVRDVLADGGDWVTVRGQRRHVQGYLKEYLFDPGLADARIASFSGGERSRLLLAREFARESSLLVLDEPTNDLDLETLDLLQEVIADYDGTVLIVSHDRDFLDRTTTMAIGLDGSGRAELVAGGYRELERLWAGRPVPRAPGKRAPAPAAPAAPAPRRKLGFREQRDLDTLPDRIADLERAIEELEARLAEPSFHARNRDDAAAAAARLQVLRADLATAEERWLTLAEAAEALAAASGRAG